MLPFIPQYTVHVFESSFPVVNINMVIVFKNEQIELSEAGKLMKSVNKLFKLFCVRNVSYGLRFSFLM
jgi:hypothetical protein